jgi:hypothetical protein
MSQRSEISHIGDLDIGGQKGKSFSFMSSEEARRLGVIHLRRTGGRDQKIS